MSGNQPFGKTMPYLKSTLRETRSPRLPRFLRLPLLCLLASTAVHADDSQPATYLKHPEAGRFIDEVVKETQFPRPELEALLASATRKDTILEAIARPAEKTKTWAEYRPIFVTQDRIDGGIDFYKTHASTLERAEKEFGVSRFIIVAIIGVETRYGKHKGNYRVIDSLATLAFDYPPRAPFFRNELKEFLHLKQEAHIDLMTAKGSYAGAMGYPQFISSSYRKWAVDFDADQHIDLIDNPVDAIGSVGSYFKAHGWQDGAPVVSLARYMGKEEDEAKLDSWVNQDLEPVHTVADFRKAGLAPDQEVADTLKATALKLEGEDGTEYWLGLNNFYVITRYNRSPLYSLSVYQLSEALRSKLNPS
ncbi:MAG TPA: lytic murein transglycosylase B [Dongiaceae bacterium]|nr:lytic murein transglycosylase B [Dongiaceae bacterium]